MACLKYQVYIFLGYDISFVYYINSIHQKSEFNMYNVKHEQDDTILVYLSHSLISYSLKWTFHEVSNTIWKIKFNNRT